MQREARVRVAGEPGDRVAGESGVRVAGESGVRVAGEPGVRVAGRCTNVSTSEVSGCLPANPVEPANGVSCTVSPTVQIRVALPAHLRTLAGLARGATEVQITVSPVAGRSDEEPGTESVTIAALLDALEERYPMLRGTIRSRQSGERRPHMRYFGEGRDLSFEPEDAPLPPSIAQGDEPFVVIGAISGG